MLLTARVRCYPHPRDLESNERRNWTPTTTPNPFWLYLGGDRLVSPPASPTTRCWPTISARCSSVRRSGHSLALRPSHGVWTPCGGAGLRLVLRPQGHGHPPGRGSAAAVPVAPLALVSAASRAAVAGGGIVGYRHGRPGVGDEGGGRRHVAGGAAGYGLRHSST
ncbi:MAG: hypothetical protein MZW92_37175 [Comamonadaceae bacterium]|nr:hypothetical protein [Comamonadaceae bacterium]